MAHKLENKDWSFRVERDVTIRKIQNEENVLVTFVVFKWEGDKSKCKRLVTQQYKVGDKQWLIDTVAWIRSGKLPDR